MLFCRSKTPETPSLLGRWKMVETDGSYELGSGVTMEFTSDGRLTYTIHQPDREQLILLKWRVDGFYIVTDQPSQPAESRTRYEFVAPDRLMLELNGEKSYFVRVPHEIT